LSSATPTTHGASGRFWNNGADDPTGSGIPPSQTSRGFTGQEMLASVALVHLNGRVYDPYVGRMTSLGGSPALHDRSLRQVRRPR
jgi:hypothetical protein